jgi:tRNA(Arg) A34 adenosine deaminase TadA
MYPNRLHRRATILGSAATCVIAEHSQTTAAPISCPDFTTAPPLRLSPSEQERHRIFLLLAMALVFDGWGVDRRRPDMLKAYAQAEPDRTFADYLGHNVGALLVDSHDRIVCFALNRNVALNSTLEHAEMRSVRGAIEIANAARPASGAPPWSFGKLLQSNRLYATLEPCAQCAGTLDLANVGSIIYGQDDPGQRHIVNVLYNLHNQGTDPSAPLPIRADFLPLFDELTKAYRGFLGAVPPASFTGLTAFLETVPAYRIYRDAADMLTTMRVDDSSNLEVLDQARMFRTQWQGRLHAGIVPI